MDQRLFEAAQAGDVNYLHQLVGENPLVVSTSSLFSTQNPLHIASVAGHVEFVLEILRLKPEFSRELDQDGFSPMHMAAANGHVEIVRELMKVDGKLCQVEGREKKTPLHYAAIKGKVHVVREIVSGRVECMEDVTVQKENALHLAVKNNQFEATRVLLELAKEMNKEDVLNMKDEQGNTVLHLATWRKQRQVIELLLRNVPTNSGFLEVSAINHSGLTAMDLLLIFPSEAGDREIEEILRSAGATRATDITLSSPPSFESHSAAIAIPATPQRCQSPQDNMVEYFKFKKGRDSPSEARSALLVIAILVATATFQAGLSPPGGVWQDSYFPGESNSTRIEGKHLAGWSVMASSNGVAFALFVLFNSIGFAVSLSMINILTYRFPLQFELQICMITMYFTYNTAMTTITPDDMRVYIIVIASVLPTVTPLLTAWLKLLLKWLAKAVMDIIHKIRYQGYAQG